MARKKRKGKREPASDKPSKSRKKRALEKLEEKRKKLKERERVGYDINAGAVGQQDLLAKHSSKKEKADKTDTYNRSEHDFDLKPEADEGDEDEGDVGGDGEEIKEKESDEMTLKIEKIETSKDKIVEHPLGEAKIIPKMGTSSIMCGTTGQGKSTLLANLATNKRFFGLLVGGKDIFEKRFLVSPTAEGDDVQKELGVEDKYIFTDLEEAPELIGEIMSAQKKKIKKAGNAKAPQYMLIYDDVIGSPALKEPEIIKSFTASRHYNLTTFLCTQSWTAVPRVCRLQCKNIFFFAGPMSEVEMLCLEYCPPRMHKRQFYALVEFATQEPYSFLYINKSDTMEKRFRRNLDEMIDLDHFRDMEIPRGGGKNRNAESEQNPRASGAGNQQQQENAIEHREEAPIPGGRRERPEGEQGQQPGY